MNTKEYIESGILEAYVLGALTPEEHNEVAANVARYPELAEEVAAIEATMQHFAEATAEEPPAYMQDQIWKALLAEQGSVLPENNNNKEAPQKVVPFTPQERIYQMNWQRAAVLLVLVGSVLANFILWNQHNHSMEKQVAMKQQLDSLQQQSAEMVAAIEHYRKENDMTADPDMQTIVMHSMVKDHPMAATVYWSKDKGDAYLAVQKLPMPPKGMQYQMWVIQDGKPVDMGVLPNSIVGNASMQKLSKLVTEGQAFAISLEKEGGSPTPTTVYVLGKVTS